MPFWKRTTKLQRILLQQPVTLLLQSIRTLLWPMSCGPGASAVGRHKQQHTHCIGRRIDKKLRPADRWTVGPDPRSGSSGTSEDSTGTSLVLMVSKHVRNCRNCLPIKTMVVDRFFRLGFPGGQARGSQPMGPMLVDWSVWDPGAEKLWVPSPPLPWVSGRISIDPRVEHSVGLLVGPERPVER